MKTYSVLIQFTFEDDRDDDELHSITKLVDAENDRDCYRKVDSWASSHDLIIQGIDFE